MSDSEVSIVSDVEKIETKKQKTEDEPAKKKRVMTEKMKQQLADARKKAHETTKAKGLITKKKKVLKNLEELEEIKKVDEKLEKKLNKKKKPEPESESESEEVVYKKKPKPKPKPKKVKKIVYVSSTDEESQDEITEDLIKKPSKKSVLREQEIEKNKIALEASARQKEYEEQKHRQTMLMIQRLGLR